ncbi:MAG: NADH-quinone oxidoreductase subunit D 1 [Actinomycetota bacterium]|nr:NADH-quinone oxidoreductase subunit D 1 [Actinomycetota bacterium]MDK1027307.1 NADH-quinone oxidoreductase subunit D 1 [Actinomycetota bacterium]MDK1097299.1 NADH-quinone oxidoreductase subunit D 1 [Actinomycetota bacterium]MDK1292422.1 NADH-quinone oxidoreductase subunit D 1 [Actinomycetota bacterium]
MTSRQLMHRSEVAVSVELETPGMTLNIGPQHPSTHGVLRLVAKISGERIHEIEPVIGYMHRGYEKLSEVRTYAQITALVNRIDWVAGFANEVPFILGVEKLVGVEAPERAQWIRLILTELARISSHLVFMCSFPLELGASTPLMHMLRDREHILELIEDVTGGRFHPNFNRVGGVKPAYGGGSKTKKQSMDLPAGFFKRTLKAMDLMDQTCEDIDTLVTGNELVRARTIGIGVIPAEKAIEYGMSGPNLRASGVAYDLRKVDNYLPYDQIDFDVVTRTGGDSFDRYLVRVGEIRESVKIIRQAVDLIPAGPLQAKVPRVLKVPEGQVYSRAENPKGEFGYYIVSEGGKMPYRLKIRSTSFSNLSILPWILVGQLIPDLVAIMGSLDFVLGDVDR